MCCYGMYGSCNWHSGVWQIEIVLQCDQKIAGAEMVEFDGGTRGAYNNFSGLHCISSGFRYLV